MRSRRLRQDASLDSNRKELDELAVKVTLASGSDAQKRLRTRLFEVVQRYGGLKEWLFTREILIDDSTIPRSHPVLALGTKSVGVRTSLGLLSLFLHEQMHWHLSQHPAELALAMRDLRNTYPEVKVGREEGGARNEESTYLHLLVCHLEAEALSNLIGRKRAFDLILKKPYYHWIYRIVVSDYQRIASVIARHRLSIRTITSRA
jgi:hypothetical protein